MNRRNLWTGVGVVVIVAAVIVFLLVHNPNKTTPANNSSQTTTSQSSGSGSTPSSGEVVTTKTDSSGVQYLADGSGNPLYTFGGDSNGVSNCTGACLVNWPIYSPSSSSNNLPANVSVITRSDGKAQYAYKGLPLYFFSSDSSGNPTGDNVSNFHLAKP